MLIPALGALLQLLQGPFRGEFKPLNVFTPAWVIRHLNQGEPNVFIRGLKIILS